jgi:hypothetical protein
LEEKMRRGRKTVTEINRPINRTVTFIRPTTEAMLDAAKARMIGNETDTQIHAVALKIAVDSASSPDPIRPSEAFEYLRGYQIYLANRLGPDEVHEMMERNDAE